MSKHNTSGVSVLARGSDAESTRAANEADIAARYGIDPKHDDEYTITEFAKLTGRKYDAAKDLLHSMCATGTWTRRKCGGVDVYREVTA